MGDKRQRKRRSMLTGLLCLLLAAGLFQYAPAVQAEENADGVYLLVGYDRQNGAAQARSDTMILCRFDKQTQRLVLVSLLRDLYLPIPGYGNNRLNAAYAYGGAQLLKETVEKNFGISIDGCIEVDFSQFARIIDLLGGAELELREDEAALISRETGTRLQPGLQRLTGVQALCYARIRSLDADGDFSRTARQRKLLGALWGSYKDCSFPRLIRVMGTLVPMLRTDLESGALLDTAVDVFPCLKQMELCGYSIPRQECCRDQVVDGMAVLTTDLESAGKMLRSYLYQNEKE